MAPPPILRPGRSCWRVEEASRIAFLVDAAEYFAALDAAFELAERSILVVGWDVDSRTELGGFGSRETFVEKLNALAARRPGLEIHILAWDYASFYLLERELLPRVQLGLKTHARVHFRLDDDHPLGASHHQKVVVVDDAIAFCGGLDITIRRWDTPEHRPGEGARRDPDGAPYDPFHDVQIAVGGKAARALGELVRERWRRATGKRLRPPKGHFDPWPPGLEAEAEHLRVAIARTEPPYRGREEVREIERLFLDAIAGTERYLYVENQFTTSRAIEEALCRRLEDPACPEILMVGPMGCSSWLEDQTMGVLRKRFLLRLRDADRHGRLKVVYPSVGETPVFIHSKVLIADDRLVVIGSANMTNRSMGLDTECNVALEPGRAGAEVPRRFLARLLAEHLGADREALVAFLEARAAAGRSGLFDALSAFGGGARTLRPVAWPEPPIFVTGIAAASDPERPLEAAEMIERALPETAPRTAERSLKGSVAVVGALAVLALLARLTPLGRALDLDDLRQALFSLRESPFAPLAVALVYAVLCLFMVPVNALVLLTGAVFGPLLGPAYALLGGLSSGAVSWLLGRHFGRRILDHFSGRRVARVERHLAKRGFAAVLLVRLVPIAPFGLLNLVAGATGVKLHHFLLGTAVGMLPGAVVVSIFGDRVLASLAGAGPQELAILLAVGVPLLLVGALVWVRRWRRRKRRGAAGAISVLPAPPVPAAAVERGEIAPEAKVEGAEDEKAPLSEPRRVLLEPPPPASERRPSRPRARAGAIEGKGRPGEAALGAGGRGGGRGA